jgi:hypothetical protein
MPIACCPWRRLVAVAGTGCGRGGDAAGQHTESETGVQLHAAVVAGVLLSRSIAVECVRRLDQVLDAPLRRAPPKSGEVDRMSQAEARCDPSSRQHEDRAYNRPPSVLTQSSRGDVPRPPRCGE